ncbi:hypothetical protein [Flavobacterium sp. 14A]|uniref:hypothetical protein n=1 Tax=Flavobacterium sp. 14A TaxID=2735896 RepID=UPI0015706C7C|nr:hypothetical protein [Flavobacterium sp. 14A]NRT13655.1 hypothetical protein [Flavobacterium sp. 14A]
MNNKKNSEKDNKYVLELKEYILTAESRMKYSLERFDILIISLSSGGLVLVMNLYTNFPCATKTVINIAWLFFSVALIVNLLSQITGYYSNKYDLKFCKNEIKITENKKSKRKILKNEELIIIQDKLEKVHINYTKVF